MNADNLTGNSEAMALQLRQDYLYMLVQGKPSWIQGLEQVNRCYQFRFPAGRYYAFILAGSCKIQGEAVPAERYEAAGACIRSGFLSMGDECEVLLYRQRLYGIVGSCREKAQMDAELHRLFEALGALPGMYTVTWTMGLGTFVSSLDQLPESLFAANHALKFSILGGTGRILDGSDGAFVYEGGLTLLTSADQVKLEQALKSTDPQAIVQYIEALYRVEKAAQIRAYPVYAYMVTTQLFEIVLQILRSVMPIDRRTFEIILACQRSIEDQLTLDSLIALAEHGLGDMYRRYEAFRRSGSSRPVWLVITYIQEHYAGQLTLDSIAAAADRNPRYISTLFKKECGMTVMQYVTSCRIEQAKTLLRSENLPVGEIAARVGYPDSRYFSRVFRQETGLSPRAFREALEQGGTTSA